MAMRIAFYAPMKAPTHPVPSGDRRMGALLMDALRAAGHEVALASELRTYDGGGNADVQREHERAAAAEAERIAAQWDRAGARPNAWFTYHVYHKAPDYLGPALARRHNLPYLIAEPSVAPKRATGSWSAGYRAALAAIGAADVLLCLTRLDMACVAPHARAPDRLVYLPPFIDTTPFGQARLHRAEVRSELTMDAGLAPDKHWLLAVGMMRAGDKLESYRRLGRALERLQGSDWQVVVAGEGDARADVEVAMAPIADRVRYLGAVDWSRLPCIYAACDLLVWPAAGEAYGIALLEAEAAGLPVVAGRVRGVPDVVEDGATGLLVPEGDADAFAAAVRSLLDDAPRRRDMAEAAMRFVTGKRNLAAAAAILDRALRLAAS